MIQLVKTDRKLDFTGVTPAFVAGATLFFCVLITGHLAGRHFDRDLKASKENLRIYDQGLLTLLFPYGDS